MYLDPGFGSMLIQMLVASLAAVAVGFGIFRHKIKSFFSKNKNADAVDGNTADGDGADGDTAAKTTDLTEDADSVAEVDDINEAGEDTSDKE